MTGPGQLAQLSSEIVEIAAAAARSIVEVASHQSLASGFIWREGLIVTADETLADEGEVLVELADGTQHRVRVVGRDPSTDIALLALDDIATQPAALVTEAPRPGALIVVAAAAESAPLVTFGSAIAVGPAWQSMRGGRIDARIELDLRLRRRAEGGLALQTDGRAIGMAVRGPRGKTLVIPSATIERVAALLLAHGEVPRGYLGLGLNDVEVDDLGRGAIIVSVDSTGPGAAAAILQGDIILRWDDAPFHSVHHAVRALDHTAIGRKIPLTLRRGGQDVETIVTVGTRQRG